MKADINSRESKAELKLYANPSVQIDIVYHFTPVLEEAWTQK